ncbi:methyltransferase domain-containing protein [candidate division KSB1 bacterium]|nr:methyltransferase domain-containing protein [candidate division KSB1 bacterium]
MQSSSSKIEKNVPPYSQLARIYDSVMAHVNYRRWADFIHSVIQKWCPAAQTVVDASCGTGTFLQNLMKYNYRLAGFDYSGPMVRQAFLKSKRGELNAPIWQDDIRTFGLSKSVEVIVCLYDSINYLMSLNHITETLTNVHRSLTQSGLFIFDICTERNSIKYFDNFIDRDSGPGYNYVRKSSFDRSQRIHSNVFHINFQDEETVFVEQHEQRIYFLEELYNIINPAQYTLVAALDGFSFRRSSERSLRAHFVLQKVN